MEERYQTEYERTGKIEAVGVSKEEKLTYIDVIELIIIFPLLLAVAILWFVWLLYKYFKKLLLK